jgi:hypothetical protein
MSGLFIVVAVLALIGAVQLFRMGGRPGAANAALLRVAAVLLVLLAIASLAFGVMRIIGRFAMHLS